MEEQDKVELGDKSLIELFLEVVEAHKDKVALWMQDEEVTYEMLYLESAKVASYLLEKGIKQEEIVGIMMERSIEMIIAMLGILMAGGTYMPIAPNSPKKRLDFMMAQGKMRFLCVLDEPSNSEIHSQCIKVARHRKLVQEESFKRPDLKYRSSSHNLAYVMFTSGSTGEPKGVMIEQQGVIRLVKSPNYITFYETDKILHAASPAFDAATFEIWGALLNGLTLCIASQEEVLDIGRLKALLHKNKVTIAWFTVALFNQYVEKDLQIFEALRVVLTGGDVLSAKHINILREAYPQLTLINGYGPTENTTFSTCYVINQHYEESIPIGRSINGTTVYIMDEERKKVADGTVGEICLGGKGLARGYLNAPHLTDEKFVDNPYAPGQKMYCTGDLGYYLKDGNVAFVGRADTQIKLRGYRIELGEIEKACIKIKGIKQVVVKLFEDEKKQKYLCAYYTADYVMDNHEIKAYLLQQLPYYMIPAYLIQIEAFPININGKIDKKLLKAPESTTLYKGTKYVAPRNEKEEILVRIWEDVLGVTPIGIENQFSDLGGDSLKAVQIITLAREKNIFLEVGELLAKETISEILNGKVLAHNQFNFVQEKYRMKNLEELKELRGEDVIATYKEDKTLESKSLPIAFQTEVTSYLHRSLPLCVILAYEAYKNWYYTNYIQIFSYTDGKNFTEVNYLEPRDSYREVADVICLGYPLLKNEKDIINFIKEKITLGYYMVMHLDEYELPCKVDYHKQHFVHPSLIYGYESESKLIKAVGFDECRMFCKLSCKEEEVKAAYESGKRYYLEYAPWCAWSAIQLIKPKTPQKSFPFSLRKFMTDLKAYMEGEADEYRLYDFEYPKERIAYGLEVEKVVAHQLRKLLKNEFTIDYRGIHLLVEHKKGLYQRFLYLGHIKNLGPQFGHCCDVYNKLVEKWENLRLNYLHEAFNEFSLEHLSESQKGMLEHISDAILKLREEEYIILQSLYKVLETSNMQ